MYWDVVEVKPEPHYCLFVGFKDGQAGRVHLREEDLTGVLAQGSGADEGVRPTFWLRLCCSVGQLVKLRADAIGAL